MSEQQVEIEKKKNHSLVILNDDINDFRTVIFLLETVCNLNEIQAEQCSLIAHSKGECKVKRGELSKMKSLRDTLDRNGLGAIVR